MTESLENANTAGETSEMWDTLRLKLEETPSDDARDAEKSSVIKDEKYIVFKREDFYQMMGALALPTGDVDCAPVAQRIIEVAETTALADAVVIRRQDLFAGPSLHAYAASITIAARLSDEARLQPIADYFHEQAILADAEGWKVPD